MPSFEMIRQLGAFTFFNFRPYNLIPYPLFFPISSHSGRALTLQGPIPTGQNLFLSKTFVCGKLQIQNKNDIKAIIKENIRIKKMSTFIHTQHYTYTICQMFNKILLTSTEKRDRFNDKTKC